MTVITDAIRGISMKKLIILLLVVFLAHDVSADSPSIERCWDDGSGQKSCIYIDRTTRALMYQKYGEDPYEIGTGTGGSSGTEIDPIVAAIEGIVKSSDGVISAATAQDIIDKLSGEQISTQFLLASGTSLPSVCSVGEQFVDTDTSPFGFYCTSLDTWNGSIKTVVSRYGFYDLLSLTTDDLGTNTPVNNGVSSASGRADFWASEGDFFEWADATLSANFPFKSGTSNTSGTFFIDVELKNLPSTSGYEVVTKYNDYTDNGSFVFGVRNSNDTWKFQHRSASGTTEINCLIVPVPGRIYKTAVSYNGGTNTVLIMIFDTVAQSLIDFDSATPGTQNWQNTFSSPMMLDSTPIRVGTYANSTEFFNGYLDNFCIYSAALTADEITAKFLED